MTTLAVSLLAFKSHSVGSQDLNTIIQVWQIIQGIYEEWCASDEKPPEIVLVMFLYFIFDLCFVLYIVYFESTVS